jgi:hypothetical protein
MNQSHFFKEHRQGLAANKAGSEWIEKVFANLGKFAKHHKVFMLETFMHEATCLGLLEEPKSSNAWGSLPKQPTSTVFQDSRGMYWINTQTATALDGDFCFPYLRQI